MLVFHEILPLQRGHACGTSSVGCKALCTNAQSMGNAEACGALAGLAWHPEAGTGQDPGAASLVTGGADTTARLWSMDGQVTASSSTLRMTCMPHHLTFPDPDLLSCGAS